MTGIETESPESLFDWYATAASEHGRATESGDYRTGNAAHDRIAAIYREIRRRGRSAQLRLLPLLEHSDAGVRLWAASHALEYEPTAAEPVLQALQALPGLLALDAKMTLDQWRLGRLSFP